MRTLIISYLLSVVPLTYIFYPTFLINPLDASMRIFFYLGFPLAVVIGLVIVAAKYFMGIDDYSSHIHSAAELAGADSGLKAS